MHKECGISGGSKPVCIGDLRMGLISRLQRNELEYVCRDMEVWNELLTSNMPTQHELIQINPSAS